MRISLAITACSTLGALILAALPAPILARPGNWGGSGWNDGYRGYGGSLLDSRARTSSQKDSREGRVQVSRFIATDVPIDALGKGPVTVTSQAPANRSGDQEATPAALEDGTKPEDGTMQDRLLADAQPDYLPQHTRAPFEAAVVDRLIAVGYDTLQANPEGGQLAELRVSRDVLVPAEGKRNPVSGTAAMQVGTRGSAYGLGVNVDMSKPRAALLSTRLDARIKDRTSGKILWEGHAQIATRDGDGKWTDSAIANRLAEALFEDFRHPTR